MSLFSEFLSYTGSNDKPNPKPVQSRTARITPAKPPKKGPAVSGTVVLPGGELAPQSLPQPPARDIELVRYSEKSFAIYGNTRPLQKQLEDLGGSFNRWLKREGVPTPGYIFSNKRLDSVRAALNL